MLRIGTWNTQWAKPNTTLGNVVRASLSYPNCDVLCVTEGYRGILPRTNYVVDGGPDWGCPIVDGRRKVLLWSKRPWSDVDCVETGRPLGGRFVAGVTETDAGPLQVVGVCIPWRDAHVKYCQKDSKQWQEHERWLSAFETLHYRQATERTIVLGDFNQTIPRRGQNKRVYEALRCALRRFTFATAGWRAHARDLAIDHIAHTPDLIRIGNIGIWPRQTEYGKRLSDHFGLWCDFDDFDPSSRST